MYYLVEGQARSTISKDENDARTAIGTIHLQEQGINR